MELSKLWLQFSPNFVFKELTQTNHTDKNVTKVFYEIIWQNEYVLYTHRWKYINSYWAKYEKFRKKNL